MCKRTRSLKSLVVLLSAVFMALLCSPSFAQGAKTTFTFSTVQLGPTSIDGGGSVTLDGSATAQVNFRTGRFSFNGAASVVKMDKLPDPFQQDILTTDIYFIEGPKFWLVLVSNPFTAASQPTPSGSLAGKPGTGGVWSLAGIAQ